MSEDRVDRSDGPLAVYLKGFCMGSADAVPGVSGGTIALIVGVYRRLVEAIAAVTPDAIRRFLLALAGRRWAEARGVFADIDGWFLLALGSGVVSAVVVVTRVLAVALADYPVVTFGFFFGLIAASAVLLWRDVTVDSPATVAAVVVGFVATFAVSGSASAVLGGGVATTVLAGAVAVSAMLLPGLSGSLLLIVLGQYERMVVSLSTFVDGLVGFATGGSTAGFDDAAVTVVAFIGGAFVGLFTVAHAVRWALRTRPQTTMTLLVALVVGALRAPVVEASRSLDGGWTTTLVGLFAVAAVVGTVAVALLERYAVDITPRT
jgi:putative membrane protein